MDTPWVKKAFGFPPLFAHAGRGPEEGRQRNALYASLRLSAVDPTEINKAGTADGLCLLLGSPCWARTSDIMINSHALYRLS